jgi:hypothetical protein
MIGACNGQDAVPVQDSGASSQPSTLSVGDELDITLVTIGPGAYDSLASVSSSAVRFLDAAYVSPYSPGGARQRFRFIAVRSGVAVITFNHSGWTNPAGTRTIEVR